MSGLPSSQGYRRGAAGLANRTSISAVTAAVTAYLLALPITGTIRPQLFGMLGFAATLWAIARLPSRKHPLAWLPALFALWANLHGSFAMGLVALGCYCLGHTWIAAQTVDRAAMVCR